MKKDPVLMTLLFDYYGGTLTEKQSDVYESYHNADFSLSEIAENMGITRQGVHDLLSRAEKSLLSLDDKLGFVARFERQKELYDEITLSLEEIDQLNKRSFSSLQLERTIQRIRAAITELRAE